MPEKLLAYFLYNIKEEAVFMQINEHYIPKTYMKGWTGDSQSVYELGLKDREIERKNIDNINSFLNLYETPELEDTEKYIEHSFSKYENTLHGLIERITSCETRLTDSGRIHPEEKMALAKAIVVMYCRNKDIFPLISDIIAGLKLENNKTFKDSLNIILQNASLSDKEKEDFVKYFSNCISIIPDSEGVRRLTETVAKNNCALLYDKDGTFMFSNLPVYVSKEESVYYMPLSPNWAVLFSNKFENGTFHTVNADEYNYLLLENGFTKYMYSDNIESLQNFSIVNAHAMNIV